MKKLDGVPYRLPRTVVQVSLPVKKVEKEPGPFVKFAPCFFTANDLGDLVTEESTKFSLQAPGFSTLGEPDPDESYVVKIKGGYFENKSLLMEYTPTGILSKGEAESKDESLEFTLKAIKTATSIAGALAGIKVPGADVNTAAMSENQRQKLLQDRQELNQQLNEAERCYHSITVYAGKTANEANIEKDKAWARLKTADQTHYAEASERYAATLEKLKAAQNGATTAHSDESRFDGSFTPQVKQLVDEYLQAREAHDRILAMQNRREVLVSQPANVNQERFNRLLEETDKTIDAYRAVFLGLQTEKVWKGVFTYRPTKSDSQLSLPFFAYK